ncbi:MAG: hypothetical protein AAFU53_18790 [Cyanobacteria bacterium J06632_3]
MSHAAGLWKKSLLSVVLHTALAACGGPDRSAIEASLAWARLSPLPEGAEQIETLVKGSSFSREFEVSFTGNEDTIRTWLQESPGTQSAEVSTVGEVSTYTIAPGEGAQFAQVSVDWATRTVTIHTYWS